MGLWDWFTGGDKQEPAPEGPQTPPAPAADDIAAALAGVERLVADPGVPGPVRSRVERITRTVRDALPRMSNLGVGSLDSYSLIATATDYLPEAVGAYLRLPRDWADSRPVENGKTSLLVLVDQLDLLGLTVDKMLDAATRTDADALIAHGRFLQARFGDPSKVYEPVNDEPAPGPAPANPLDLE
ncbi:hypothetical protein [Propionicicella superfundia]|uniref:hypothetical protein n=1 Tax=Propionicicella superfundia TaxID=348582 RepID=UPI0004282421|nr:hypothetical protein [Propionicicella superfundia]